MMKKRAMFNLQVAKRLKYSCAIGQTFKSFHLFLQTWNGVDLGVVYKCQTQNG